MHSSRIHAWKNFKTENATGCFLNSTINILLLNTTIGALNDKIMSLILTGILLKRLLVLDSFEGHFGKQRSICLFRTYILYYVKQVAYY